MHMHTHDLRLWNLWKTEPAHLEINEIITGVSLSTGTSFTTKRIALLNPEKYEHPCQIENVDSDGWVPTQGT